MKILNVNIRNFFRQSNLSSSIYQPLDDVPTVGLFQLLKYFFFTGAIKGQKLKKDFLTLSDKYGPLFNVKIFRTRMFISTDPENALKIFRNEGKCPVRVTFPALYNYIDEKLHCHSVVTSSGAEWYRIRKSLDPIFSKETTHTFLGEHEKLADNFISLLRAGRGEDLVHRDVFTAARLNGFEMGMSTFFGVKVTDDEYAQKILDGSMKFLNGINETAFELPIWKFYKTLKYRNFEEGFDILIECANTMIDKIQPLDGGIKPLAQLIQDSGKLSKSELKLFIAESICQTIDAVPMAIALSLYHLSQNPKHQLNAIHYLQNGSKKYLKGCIKEALRLNHYGGEFTRQLASESVMNNYAIPANTQVIFYSPASSVMVKYFDNPKLFNPERWLRNELGELQKKHPCSHLASLPFGLGKRICIGRFISYQYATCILQKVLESFRLECCTNSLVKTERPFIKKPDRPIQIRFVDRNM